MSPKRKKTAHKAGSRSRPLRAPTGDSSVDLARLLEIAAGFQRRRICVIGDMLLDEFVSGEISRVSREAPVLILRHRRSESYPGGGANAVNNLAALGATVHPVGIVGDDGGGEILLECFRRKHVDTSGIIRARQWITTRKTRYLAGWAHTAAQQVLRVDRQPEDQAPARVREAMWRKASKAARAADAVLISDYGLGSATPEIASRLKSKVLTLDSRYRLLDYVDAGITAATPNEAELEAAYHTVIGTDTTKLEELGRRALRDLRLQALVVTRGRHGLTLFEGASKNASANRLPARYVPIYGSAEALDVTGAGDTVIAVFTLAIAAGASYLEAAHLANYAGGIVVMKRRTATVTSSELESALRREATAAH